MFVFLNSVTTFLSIQLLRELHNFIIELNLIHFYSNTACRNIFFLPMDFPTHHNLSNKFKDASSITLHFQNRLVHISLFIFWTLSCSSTQDLPFFRWITASNPNYCWKHEIANRFNNQKLKNHWLWLSSRVDLPAAQIKSLKFIMHANLFPFLLSL